MANRSQYIELQTGLEDELSAVAPLSAVDAEDRIAHFGRVIGGQSDRNAGTKKQNEMQEQKKGGEVLFGTSPHRGLCWDENSKKLWKSHYSGSTY